MSRKNQSKNALFRLASLALILTGVLLFMNRLEESNKSVSANGQAGVDYTYSFIQEIAPSAVAIANAHDLYPSVMIAQAIHESNAGQSGLAASYNNLFGIKGSYQGQAANLKTWEDDGQGNPYEIMANFRAYPTRAESLEDYANLLDWSYYSAVHRSNTTSYMDATAALSGTYATDTTYAARLNYYIQAYNLTAYDNGGYADASAPSDQVAGGLVWNEYRLSYTSQDVLNLDIAWANRFK